MCVLQALADRINEGSPEGCGPVHLVQRHVPLHERIALFSVADCCVVTATRDGMNLAPYEYVACRQGPEGLPQPGEGEAGAPGMGAGGATTTTTAATSRGAGAGGASSRASPHAATPPSGGGSSGGGSGGCGWGGSASAVTSALVVSEFVGCSPSLSGALRVNPWNVEETADALFRAISTPPHERAARHAKHWRYVAEHTAAYWAAACFGELQRACAGHAALRRVVQDSSNAFRTVVSPKKNFH